ncbi:hypothetical protein GF380_06525, partial [Candidatus Uhrbacteria bacterium]|nr:hypothetical protein [Candidatus Uhrbacteria bacterium]MBD3284589.1 hypothetical protein [Candidatus Uhrbacteria bacterium]
MTPRLINTQNPSSSTMSRSDEAQVLGILGRSASGAEHAGGLERTIRQLEAEVRCASPDLHRLALLFWSVSRVDPERVGPRLLTSIVRILLCAERKSGGPYASGSADPDVIVNAYLCSALWLHDMAPEALYAWVESAVLEASDPQVCQCAFLLASGGCPTDRLQTRLQTMKQSDLDPHARAYAHRFFPDPSSRFVGSDPILEALYAQPSDETIPTPFVYAEEVAQSFASVESEIQRWPSELREQILPTVRRVQRAAGDDFVARLLWTFFDALKDPRPNAQEMTKQLTTSLIWVWVTYTLLDDIYDGDVKPDHLPAVQMSFRRMRAAVQSACPEQMEFQHSADAL